MFLCLFVDVVFLINILFFSWVQYSAKGAKTQFRDAALRIGCAHTRINMSPRGESDGGMGMYQVSGDTEWTLPEITNFMFNFFNMYNCFCDTYRNILFGLITKCKIQ